MASSSKSRWPFWLFIVALLGGAVWGGLRWQAGQTAKAAAPDFKTNVVGRGEITQSVTANGGLTPVRVVSVGSQVSGIITEMNVDFNSKVREGDILAKIDPSTFERELARAEADLASAVAGQALALFNQKRSQELFNSKLVSETEHEQTRVNLLQADAMVKMREAAVAKAKVDVERTTILAPISGMVISRRVEAGQTVAASLNTPELFTIANDLAKMQIETMVSEADVGGVEVGQNVNFLVDAFPNRKFAGRVKQVRFAPITNQNVITYAAIVEVDNRDMKLRPGMTANATIITSQRTNVLKISNAALRFRPSDPGLVASTNNAVAKAAGTNLPAGLRPPEELPTPPWMAERRRPTDEERTKYEASLTPEQKEQYRELREKMRAMMAAGGGPGGPGGGAGGGGNRAAVADGPAIRTVYILDRERSSPGRPVLQAVSIKTGISDGTNTEIAEGLMEGDVVIIGVASAATTAATAPPANPFGGPFGGGAPRR
jgi:HlyD family secretion protein